MIWIEFGLSRKGARITGHVYKFILVGSIDSVYFQDKNIISQSDTDQNNSANQQKRALNINSQRKKLVIYDYLSIKYDYKIDKIVTVRE